MGLKPSSDNSDKSINVLIVGRVVNFLVHVPGSNRLLNVGNDDLFRKSSITVWNVNAYSSAKAVFRSNVFIVLVERDAHTHYSCIIRDKNQCKSL